MVKVLVNFVKLLLIFQKATLDPDKELKVEISEDESFRKAKALPIHQRIDRRHSIDVLHSPYFTKEY